MKQSVVLGIILLLISCQNNKSSDLKVDSTYKVVYKIGEQYNMALGKVVGFESRAVMADSNSAKVSKEPIWSLNVPDPARKDTMRGVQNKPLYDSVSRSYRFNNVWYTLNPEERKTVKIQIISI